MLEGKPGHLFSKDDGNTVISILATVLYFCWGAILISAAKHLIVRISRDEYIDVFGEKKEIKREIEKLDGMLRRIERT